MDMLGYACLASLNVILISGYGTIMSKYALQNRDITNSLSSLLYQDAWHYDYVNPLTAKFFNLNFHSLEVVSR